MSTIIPPPQPPEVVTQEEYAADWRELDGYLEDSGRMDTALEERVTQLEHALVSRKARRALRRQIRRDDAAWRRVAGSFRDRRFEIATHLFLNRGQR